MTPSPVNLSTVPLRCCTTCVDRLTNSVMTSRNRSAPSVAASSIECTTSANSTVNILTLTRSETGNLARERRPLLLDRFLDDRHGEAVPALGANRLNRRRLQPRVCAHHLQHVAPGAGLQVFGRRVEDASRAGDVVHHDD